MGRRKKEEPEFHRECIAQAAQTLFMEKGIEATTMDDIAKHAQYSKATLYVYYQNKEEIVANLALKSMNLLHECLHDAVSKQDNTLKRYEAICYELVHYYEQNPLYYETAIGEINIDFEASKTPLIDREIYEVGELIIQELENFLVEGMKEHVLRENMQISQTLFFFWASLSGIIIMATKKHIYMKEKMGVSKQEFLAESFNSLLRSILI